MKRTFFLFTLPICCLLAVSQVFADPSAASRNSFSNIKMVTECSDSLRQKNAESDTLLPAVMADKALADAIRQDPRFWSIGRIKGRKETIVTQLNVKIIFIDGVREEAFCELDKDADSHAGEWNVRIGVDFVSAGSNNAHAHVQQCLDYVRDEVGYAIMKGDKVIFVPPRLLLEKKDDDEGPETSEAEQNTLLGKMPEINLELPKWLKIGLLLGLTYNDLYGTTFGLSDIEATGDYTINTSGADDLLGNYWGVGINAGIGALFLITERWSAVADFEIAFRRGSGQSKVTVELDWEDDSRQSQVADLEIGYYESLINIDIPMTARFMVPDVMYAEAGALFSFNFYSMDKSVVTDEYETRTYRESNGVNVFEFGLVFGVGTMRPMRRGKVDFNYRFFLGLTPLCDVEDSPRTWQMQFNIGYWFF